LFLGMNRTLTYSIFNYLKISGGMSLNDRLAYKEVMVKSAITSMKKIIERCMKKGIVLDEIMLPCVTVLNLETTGRLTPEAIDPIKKLLEHKLFKNILSKIKKPLGFELFDNYLYFLESFGRISEEGYIPNDEEIFRALHVPTGVMETTIDFVSMKFKYIFYDCPIERTRYIQCFSDINLLIFCSDIAIYDGLDKFDNEVKYFTDIINSKIFHQANILLLFKKRDSFLNKTKPVESDLEEEEKISLYLSKLYFEKDKYENDREQYCYVIENISEIVQVIFEVQKSILSDCDYDN